MFKGILKLVMALVLILSITLSLSVTAFAAEEKIVCGSIDPISFENGVYMAQDGDYNPENYSKDKSAFADIIREGFINRQTNITIKFADTVKHDGTSIRNEYTAWIDKALAETQNANEGDYLRYHYLGYETERINYWTNDQMNFYYTIVFNFKYATNKQQEEAVTQKIDDLIEEFGFTKDTTDKQKCDAIYDYITSNVVYDNEHYGNDAYTLQFSAYAALINKTAVCQGYANLFYRLARECGLSCRIVTGWSNGEAHAWNIVKIGNFYYFVDSTWDAGKVKYNYYLKGSDDFEKHILDEQFEALEFVNEYTISKTSYVEGGSNEGCQAGHTYDNSCDTDCNKCGTERVISHKFEWIVDKAGNCGESGLKHQECIVCGIVQNMNTVISPTGKHTYLDGSDTVCDVCGQSRDLVYDLKINTDQEIKLKFSSTNDFLVTVSDEGIAKITAVTEAEESINGEIYKTKTVTFSPVSVGCVSIKTLSLNGMLLSEKVLLVEEGKHQMQFEKLLKEADCTEDGTEKYVCKFCDYTEERSITKLGHKYDNNCDTACNTCGQIREPNHNFEWVIDKKENCAENGFKHQECIICGAKASQNTEIPATNQHIYDDPCDAVCNLCSYERKIAYDKKLTTDQTVNLAYSSVYDFRFVISDESIAEISKVESSIKNVDGIATKTATATLSPLKPGYVLVKIVDQSDKILAQSVIYIVEGKHQMQFVKVLKKASCSENGKEKYDCKFCDYTEERSITKSAHKYDNSCDETCNECGKERDVEHTYKKYKTTDATTSKNGKKYYKCADCGATKTSTIYKASKIKLSTEEYTYNGKTKKPSVKIYTSKGKKLTEGDDYKLSRPKSSKKVGKYKIKITFKGDYTGTKSIYYTINPKGTKVSSVSAAKKSLKVKISKQSTQTTGYQIQYSTSSKFKSAKTKTISSYKTTSYTIKSLKAKKTYYVRVRTYKTVDGKKYYSDWSKAVKKKTK